MNNASSINGHDWVKRDFVWECSKCGEVTHYTHPSPEMKLMSHQYMNYEDHGDRFKSLVQVWLTCEEFVVSKTLDE